MSNLELVFKPETGTWAQVIVEGSSIMDCIGLTPGGVAQRYDKNDILIFLRRAITRLETA